MSLILSVYHEGELKAKVRYASDAAAFALLQGAGAEVRYKGRHVLWTVDEDDERSYDEGGVEIEGALLRLMVDGALKALHPA